MSTRPVNSDPELNEVCQALENLTILQDLPYFEQYFIDHPSFSRHNFFLLRSLPFFLHFFILRHPPTLFEDIRSLFSHLNEHVDKKRKRD